MISRQGVTRVAAQNHSQELSLPYPAEMSLRLQKQGGRLLSGLEIVLEQQHSWQRGGEVINLRGCFGQLATVCQQLYQQSPRGGLSVMDKQPALSLHLDPEEALCPGDVVGVGAGGADHVSVRARDTGGLLQRPRRPG